MADQGADDWTPAPAASGGDDWTPAPADQSQSLAAPPASGSLASKVGSLVDKVTPFLSAGTPDSPKYNAGVDGAWAQMKADAKAASPGNASLQNEGFWGAQKQEFNRMISLGKLPWDAFSTAMAYTGIPQAFGAANEAAGAGVAKVLPATPQTPDVASSFSTMLGTAEQLAMPEKGGPIQTILNKVSPAGTPPAAPKTPTTIEGTYTVANGDSGPTGTLQRIAAGMPPGANDWAPEATAATSQAPAPAQAPATGDVLGIRAKSGAPRRATVDHYFDNGNAVRLRMDDGSMQDLTTQDMLNSRTDAPAPMQESTPPPNAGQQLGPDETPFPDDWYNEANIPTAPRQQPAQAPLGGDMLNALDHADSLEKTALNPALNLSGGSRQDMLTEAARLRRQFGMTGEEGTPPNAYRPSPPTNVGDFPLGQGSDYAHPMADEPAADLGPLAAARVSNPNLYQGTLQRTPGEPPVDPYALQDVQTARAPMPKKPSLFDAIRSMGGVKPDPGGDIAQIMQGFKNPPFVKRVVNPDGMPLDDVRNQLQQDGWFGTFDDQFGPTAMETGSYPGDDIQDLKDLMDPEARGEKIYHPESGMDSALSERAYLDQEMGEAGITASDPDPVAAKKLAAYRQQRGEDYAPQNLDNGIAELPDEDRERTEQYGYEPGADVGEEHEESGGAGEGAEGPEDWVTESGDHPEGEGESGGDSEAPAEGNAVTGPGRGPGLKEPDDLFATEPGAVDAQGRALPQTIIPGAEASAKQLAAAREAEGKGKIASKAMQKAPGGLFGEEEPPAPNQGSLFQPGPMSFPSRAGEFKDLAPEFADWMQRGDYPTDNLGLSQALREYLINRGAATDHESLGLHDPSTSVITHLETEGEPNTVAFSDGMARSLMDPNGAFVAHHNHPNSKSLSSADIGALAYPGMHWVIAHAHDGNFFAARLSQKLRAGVEAATSTAAVKANNLSLRNIVTQYENALYPYFQKAVNDGRLTTAEANDAWNHAAMTALAQHGAIDYITSKELQPHVQSVAEAAINGSTKVPLNRPANPVRYDQGISDILGSVPKQSAPADTGGSEKGQVVHGQGSFKFDEPSDGFPVNPSDAADRRDSASDEMAEQLRAAPPGTYSRQLHRMSPPSGLPMFKNPNAVQNMTIRPETLARMDTRSAAKWNAEKAKEADANSMVDDLRDRISDTMLKLDDTSRNKVYAARELDRINHQTRTDTGHQIVARNDGADFARHSKPGQVVTLNHKETAAYHALTDMFDRAWKNIMEGAARKVGWQGSWDKDDMDANMKAMQQATTESADRGTQRVATRAAKIVSALDEQRRQGYHPLMRFGDYYAHVTPKMGTDMASTGGFPKTAWFELAEKGLEQDLVSHTRVGNEAAPYAKDMLDRVQTQFPADKFNVEHGFLAKNPDMLDRVDIPAIEKLMMFMENDMLHSLRTEARGRGMSKDDAADFARQKYDDLYGHLVDQLWEKTFKELEAGYRKKANTIGGYSPDFDRALGTYMHWTSRNVAEQIHRPAIDEADTAMQTDPRVNPLVKRYWKNWTDYQRSPSNIFNKSVNGLARWGFLTSMGVNPSSTAVVGTHGLFMAGPTLSVGIGMKRAAPAYTKAMGHALSAIKVGKDGLSIPDVTAAGRTPAERALLAKLDAEGILHSRAIEDMSALNEKQSSLWGSARSQARKVMDLALSNVSVMDRANRIASTLAAHRLSGDPATLAAMDKAWGDNQIWRDRRQQGGVNQENMTRFMVPNMVGEFGKMNQAPAERNAFSRMMLGMHGFVTRLLGKMWQLGTTGPQGRQALLWTLGAFWLMAGLDGEPFSEDAQNAADAIWKAATSHDPMLGYRIQSELASLFGKAGSEMLLYGPPAALGVDLHDRLGLGDLISRNWPTAENTLGAYPAIILGRVLAARKEMASGQYEAAAAQALPGGLRNAAMAAIEKQQGVRTQAGRTEVPAGQITPADTAARALGFTPEKTEEAYQRGDYQYRARHSGMGAPPNPIPDRQARGGRTRPAVARAIGRRR